MRLVVILQTTDLQGLARKLFTGATSTVALERVKRLNPHADLQHVAPGTVLLWPDLPVPEGAASSAIGDDLFDGFSKDVASGLEAVAKNLRAGAASRAADRGAVEGVLKLDGVKRTIEADAALKKQVDEVLTSFDTDQKEAHAASKMVNALQKGAASELAALSKLLGSFDSGTKPK